MAFATRKRNQDKRQRSADETVVLATLEHEAGPVPAVWSGWPGVDGIPLCAARIVPLALPL